MIMLTVRSHGCIEKVEIFVMMITGFLKRLWCIPKGRDQREREILEHALTFLF